MSNSYAAHLKHVFSLCERALDKFNLDGLVICSGIENYFLFDDHRIPFRPNPYFSYFVPQERNPHCFIIVEKGKKAKLLYYLPKDYWHKRPSLPEDSLGDLFDLNPIETFEEGLKRVSEVKGEVVSVGPNLSLPFENNRKDVLIFFDYHRGVKTPFEITCLEKANALAFKAHQKALANFLKGRSEYEIHLDYLKTLGVTENELPYSNIVAFNENASILHYTVYEKKKPKEYNSFLLDAGSSYGGYHSDITRTYSSVEEFSFLIEKMDLLQRELVQEVVPGISFVELQEKAHQKIAVLLLEMGFVDMAPEKMVQEKVTNKFFPHGLGHAIGLQVHDVGSNFLDEDGSIRLPPPHHPYLRSTTVLRPGNVLTIEPGLYFIEILLNELKKSCFSSFVNWKKVETFKRMGGIRIEDNICVTEKGPFNLTRKYFS